MTNEILKAVARALGGVYENYPVYTEEVKQGLKKPAFFIKVNEPKKLPALSAKTRLYANIEVQFFPESKSKNSIMNDVAKSVCDLLEYLEVGECVLHGVNIHCDKKGGVGVSGFDTQYESMEGVLGIYADYIYTIKDKKLDNDNIMDKLSHERGLK